MLYSQLPIYNDLYVLNDNLLRITLRFNQGYKYTLGTKIQDNALMLITMLYEVQSGLYEKKVMITKMRVLHEQLIVLLRLARDRWQISPSDHLLLHPALVSIGKQLTSRSQRTSWKKSSGDSTSN